MGGYHLSDILLQVCFVAGDWDVFKEYIGKVFLKLLSRPDRKEKFLQDCQQYAEEFNIEKVMINNFFSSSANLKLIF